MNKGMKFTLLLIGAFLIAMSASFIWFVATWDKDAEDSIGQTRPTQGTTA